MNRTLTVLVLSASLLGGSAVGVVSAQAATPVITSPTAKPKMPLYVNGTKVPAGAVMKPSGSTWAIITTNGSTWAVLGGSTWAKVV
jgi:hypothetical protein